MAASIGWLAVILGLVCCVALLHATNPLNPTWPPPPEWTEKPKMARYLAHYADWCVMSSLSVKYGGLPFGDLMSFADGLMANSTGTPYFYLGSIMDTMLNLKANNSVSVSIVMAESDICKKKGWDAMSPVCAKLGLFGKVVAVEGSEEMFAKTALFTRHPAMKGWPKDHGWGVYKLVINTVYLVDYFGGATIIPVKEYYQATPGI